MTASAAATPAPQRAALFETHLYAASPFPQAVTSILIAALVFGAFAGLSALHGDAVIGPGGLEGDARVALILSLLLATALDLPERARRIWVHEADALKSTLAPAGASGVDGLGIGQPRAIAGSVWLWFAGGGALGIGFDVLVLAGSDAGLKAHLNSPALWAFIVAPLLFGLGGRAVRLMSEDDRTIAALVAEHLVVDFADLDRLHVYGRVGLRTALIWLMMAGLVLAFLAVEASVAASAAAFALSVAAAVWSMLTVTRPVASRVDSEKGRALLSVRRDLVDAAAMRESSPGRLADLTAYEAWLEKRPVWPVSAPVTRRLALYGLIPVLAWFGAAGAELVVDSLT